MRLTQALAPRSARVIAGGPLGRRFRSAKGNEIPLHLRQEGSRAWRPVFPPRNEGGIHPMERRPIAPPAEMHPRRPACVDDHGARNHGDVVIPRAVRQVTGASSHRPLPRYHLKPGAIVNEKSDERWPIDVRPHVLGVEALVGGAHLRRRLRGKNI